MIENSTLFQGLPAPLLDKISHLCVTRRLEAEHVLFRKGDPGDALYGILSGRLRIHTYGADGRDALLNIMQPGDLFGEIALVDGLPRTADATTLEPVELIVLRRHDFLDLLRRESDLALHVLQLTCRRLRFLSETIEDATFLPAPARLAKRLLHLAKTLGRPHPQGTLIDLRLSQRTIGDLAGLSRETTNKHLKTWERLGWLTMQRETIVICAMQPFEELADTDTNNFA